jgi:hypothetical protein
VCAREHGHVDTQDLTHTRSSDGTVTVFIREKCEVGKAMQRFHAVLPATICTCMCVCARARRKGAVQGSGVKGLRCWTLGFGCCVCVCVMARGNQFLPGIDCNTCLSVHDCTKVLIANHHHHHTHTHTMQ